MWRVEVYCESIEPLNVFTLSSRAKVVQLAKTLSGMQWCKIFLDGKMVGMKKPKFKQLTWTTEQRRKMITIKNNYHNTEIKIRLPLDGVLSLRQTRKVKKALCGKDDCFCGIVCGPQDGYDISERSDRRFEVIDLLSEEQRTIYSEAV